MSEGQYVPGFEVRPNRFSLLNSSPEPVFIRWAGIQFTIPGMEEVSQQSPAKDADGDPIPGSFVVEDGYAPQADGSWPKGGARNWQASAAIKHALGINDDTGVAEGAYAQKGISFLPAVPTKEVVAKIREAGKVRWSAFLVDWAQYEVSAQQAQEALARAHGRQPAPPGKDYAKALAILKTSDAATKRALGQDVPEDPATNVDVDEDSITFRAFAYAEALKLSEKAAADKQVDKRELAENLLADPEVRQHLKKQFRIRKVGHLPEPDEAGDSEA